MKVNNALMIYYVKNMLMMNKCKEGVNVNNFLIKEGVNVNNL